MSLPQNYNILNIYEFHAQETPDYLFLGNCAVS